MTLIFFIFLHNYLYITVVAVIKLLNITQKVETGTKLTICEETTVYKPIEKPFKSVLKKNDTIT